MLYDESAYGPWHGPPKRPVFWKEEAARLMSSVSYSTLALLLG